MTEPAAITAGQLRSIIERLERLEEDKKALSEDMKQVMGEAKANGFDPKILRKVLKIRKMEDADRQEQNAILGLYLQALGMDSEPGEAEAAVI